MPGNLGDNMDLLRSIIRFMKESQELSLSDLITLYSEVSPDDVIPLSIFSHSLSPSESLCRFLKRKGLSFHQIAVLLNRDDRSVWTSYHRAIRKDPSEFVPLRGDLMIPIEIFQDRSLSILESLVEYLRTRLGLSNQKIAVLLNKKPGSIATVAKRARVKR